ncbi:MAG TPA: serine/threonine-protein kinase, partial [Polyangiaceae bacterium]
VWMVARRSRPLVPALLHAMDGLGTLSICVCLVLMGYHISLVNPWGLFASTLSVFHVTMARAIIVPSTPMRTLMITALSFAGLVLSHRFAPVPPELAVTGIKRWALLIGPFTWSASGSALATLASAVVYGLHERVREARHLGQYTLEERIGAGGMGEVYRARHAMLRRPTAVKLLAGQVSDEQVRRFEREVQLTALLRHPNTVSIFDYGHTPEGDFYYAMELLDGMTLEELVERYGAQPPSRVVHILTQVCGALREAHEAGLIHRDIKPANIFLCRSRSILDMVKVLDFGLVKEVKGTGGPADSNVNVIIGTPLYMSPEAIAEPDSIDARSDLYALGAVAYYLLAGSPVFGGNSVVEICGHHLHTPPPPLSSKTEQTIPPELESIVIDCLAKDPSARPASARDLGERLQRCPVAPWTETDAEAYWRAARVATTRAVSVERRTIRINLHDRH